MQNNIPIPTDNIFKFYALFGLLLVIFAAASTLYTNTSTNAALSELIIEVESLKSIEKPTAIEASKRKIAERRLAITISDKEFYKYSLSGLLGIGLLVMGYGFWRWHWVIQPVQDETARLQLEKLQIEVAVLKLHNAPSPSKPASQPLSKETVELCS